MQQHNLDPAYIDMELVFQLVFRKPAQVDLCKALRDIMTWDPEEGKYQVDLRKFQMLKLRYGF